jgi:AraC-like DNA-binding protein
MADQTLANIEAAVQLEIDFRESLQRTPPWRWTACIEEFTTRLAALRLESHALLLLLSLMGATIARLSGCRERLPLQLLNDPRCFSCASSEVCQRFFDETVHWLSIQERQRIVHATHARRVARFIDEHLHEPVTLQQIANISGWRRSYLAAVFRRAMGISPHEYIVRSKIRKAAELIRSGEKVEAVMLLVGYRNKTNFYREFKRLTGMTPGQYRRDVEQISWSPRANYVRQVPRAVKGM